MYRWVQLLSLSLLSLLVMPAAVVAQRASDSSGPTEDLGDAIALAEVLPALADTELGAIVVGPAPAPGTSRRVRRSEVLAALEREGRSARGLAIPRVTTVRRERVVYERDSLAELLHGPLVRELGSCRLESLSPSGRATLARAPTEVDVEVRLPQASSRAAASNVGGTAILRDGRNTVRVPFRARVSCPAPVVRPGNRIWVRVRVGPVIARAEAEVRQPGRIGDVIRVRNVSTRAVLQARILDAETAEVVR